VWALGSLTSRSQWAGNLVSPTAVQNVRSYRRHSLSLYSFIRCDFSIGTAAPPEIKSLHGISDRSPVAGELSFAKQMKFSLMFSYKKIIIFLGVRNQKYNNRVPCTGISPSFPRKLFLRYFKLRTEDFFRHVFKKLHKELVFFK
jgi:hypothetical protein